MSKFDVTVSELVVKEYKTTILIGDMDIARLVTHSQQIEVVKLMKKMSKNKRART